MSRTSHHGAGRSGRSCTRSRSCSARRWHLDRHRQPVCADWTPGPAPTWARSAGTSGSGLTMMAAMMFGGGADWCWSSTGLRRERSAPWPELRPAWILSSRTRGLDLVRPRRLRPLRLVVHVGGSFFDWDRGGRWVAGSCDRPAGLYELTRSSRSACVTAQPAPLRHGGWRSGRVGAVRMGVEHGAYCVGCCWA